MINNTIQTKTHYKSNRYDFVQCKARATHDPKTEHELHTDRRQSTIA